MFVCWFLCLYITKDKTTEPIWPIYDVNAQNSYFFFKKNLSNKLKIFQERNDSFMDAYQPNKYTPAIYTHCYDVSGTRLFAAGGPLQNQQMVRQAGVRLVGWPKKKYKEHSR